MKKFVKFEFSIYGEKQTTSLLFIFNFTFIFIITFIRWDAVLRRHIQELRTTKYAPF